MNAESIHLDTSYSGTHATGSLDHSCISTARHSLLCSNLQYMYEVRIGVLCMWNSDFLFVIICFYSYLLLYAVEYFQDQRNYP